MHIPSINKKVGSQIRKNPNNPLSEMGSVQNETSIDLFVLTVRDNKYFDYPFRTLNLSSLNPGLSSMSMKNLPDELKACSSGILVTNNSLLKDLDNLEQRCLSATAARKISSSEQWDWFKQLKNSMNKLHKAVQKSVEFSKKAVKEVKDKTIDTTKKIVKKTADATKKLVEKTKNSIKTLVNKTKKVVSKFSLAEFVPKTEVKLVNITEEEIEKNEMEYLKKLKGYLMETRYKIGNLSEENLKQNKTVGSKCPNQGDSNYIELTDELFPLELNFELSGIINKEVFDQGECGSCWAFSVAGMLESRRAFQAARQPLSLSRQFLLDCVSPGNCSGGHHIYGLQYALEHPLYLDRDYRYKRKKEGCRAVKGSLFMSHLNAFSIHESLTSAELKYLLLKGPVAVGIDAKRFEFVFYADGILPNNNCKQPNHSMLVFGWGWDTHFERKYWILRNSWGKDWGLSGNVKIEMDNNGCSIYKNVVEAS